MESKNREIVLALREIAAGKVVYAQSGIFKRNKGRFQTNSG